MINNNIARRLVRAWLGLSVAVVCGVGCVALGNVQSPMLCVSSGAVETVSSDLNITAKSAFLMEANSGKTIFTKDEHKRLPIASMVKITTLAVIYDALEAGEISMSDKVMVSRQASSMGGSQAFLDFDSEYTVEDLIKSIIIASANDSCVAMAEHIAGSESEFVNRMNELAKRLGLENTNYVNVTGLPAPNSFSSAHDVAQVYRYLTRSPFYSYKIGDTAMNLIWMYDLQHPSGRVTGLTNTNRHARFFNGVTGGKTGFTNEAGHCITVSSQRGSMRPIAVIIGAGDSTTRFGESGALMDHVFGAYENKLIVDNNVAIGSTNVKGGMQEVVQGFARENFFDLVKKGDKSATPVVTTEMFEGVKAPLSRNSVIGRIIVTDEGVVVREIDIVPGHDVREMGYMDAVRKITSRFKL